MAVRPPARSVAWPSSVGRYEIVRPIARGGMAEVYLARTRPLAGVERLFALKVCHPHLRQDHEFAAMFIEEARLAAQIRHPNVVATFDVGDDELLYLVMEYVEGEPLSELIKAGRKKGERLPPSTALRIMVDALAGLHAAHQTRSADGLPLGIVHRDVSPQNILVGLDGVSRIVDFGIAKAESSATVTREGQVKGKLAYLPPEQLTEHVMTRRGDVYAVGVVLWETLTGRRLFAGENAGEIALRVLEMAVETPSVVANDIPPALDGVVLKALLRDPAGRFATAAEFGAALQTCGVPLASHAAVGVVVAALHGARTVPAPAGAGSAAPSVMEDNTDSPGTTTATLRVSNPRLPAATGGPEHPLGSEELPEGAGARVDASTRGAAAETAAGRRRRITLLAGVAAAVLTLSGATLMIAERAATREAQNRSRPRGAPAAAPGVPPSARAGTGEPSIRPPGRSNERLEAPPVAAESVAPGSPNENTARAGGLAAKNSRRAASRRTSASKRTFETAPATRRRAGARRNGDQGDPDRPPPGALAEPPVPASTASPSLRVAPPPSHYRPGGV